MCSNALKLRKACKIIMDNYIFTPDYQLKHFNNSSNYNVIFSVSASMSLTVLRT